MTDSEIQKLLDKYRLVAVQEMFENELFAFARAIAAKEREACAKLCEDLSKMFSSGDEYMDGVLDCIDAIKARGE